MEYLLEQDQKVHKLTKEERLSYEKLISEDFDTYDNARQQNLSYARRLSNEVYFKNQFVPKQEGKKDWKSKVKMCKMFKNTCIYFSINVTMNMVV